MVQSAVKFDTLIASAINIIPVSTNPLWDISNALCARASVGEREIRNNEANSTQDVK